MNRFLLKLLVGITMAFLAIKAARPEPIQTTEDIVFPPRSGNHLILPIRAIDGDTIEFYWLVKDHGRLKGINAPEVHGAEKEAGLAAKKYLEKHLPKEPTPSTAYHHEKYGRSLLTVYGTDGKDLSKVMLDAGHAKEYLPDR